ncbi:hypothetical protein [Litorivita sp. NS0012-18]|uniref:hypothetical protein n=1 Tax=Litorivita sp. NS0012-18 TaxID=3127655 RepID=UPI003104DE28
MKDALFFMLLCLPFIAVLVAGYGGYRQRVPTAILAVVLLIGVPGLVLTAAYFISSVLGADDPDARLFFMLVLMGHLGALAFSIASFALMWRLRNAQERRRQREQGVFASKRQLAAATAKAQVPAQDESASKGTGTSTGQSDAEGYAPSDTLEFSRT